VLSVITRGSLAAPEAAENEINKELNPQLNSLTNFDDNDVDEYSNMVMNRPHYPQSAYSFLYGITGKLRPDQMKNTFSHFDRYVKRMGSEFLGKRMGSEFLGKRMGSEFLGKRMGSEFLGKRMGSEFLGRQVNSSQNDIISSQEEKRYSEFLGGPGKRSPFTGKTYGNVKRYSEFLGGPGKRYSEFLGGPGKRGEPSPNVFKFFDWYLDAMRKLQQQQENSGHNGMNFKFR
ncbi:MIP-related peptides-like protein, partial [Dinothrombium tinctorium]